MKIYKKIFSKIENFQNSKIVEYKIIENIIENKKYYGISIKQYFNNIEEEKLCENISPNKKQIENIIKLLYENSVSIINFMDIVSDFML